MGDQNRTMGRKGLTQLTIFERFSCQINNALDNLVPFVQFKKREKHPWGSVTLVKFRQTLLKLTLRHGCFSRFVHCTNDNKSHKASQIT